ncbi:YeiH family protein [Erysipelothrix sp. HDW6A]|uniref:YeiH family protein n=1 Tax=Erysipelothrix sp. HDW6A TaxID=2714928 RepID=UPI001F0ECECE|nr:YeiH family protein [Erysipelothrix sp. HDW6A]
MSTKKTIYYGVGLSFFVAATSYLFNQLIPNDVLGLSLTSLIIGMLLNPFVEKRTLFESGINWTSKRILKLGIILSGITLSFSQIIETGQHALILMVFTLSTAFGVGILCRKFFKINWKLSSLLSVSTAICGGTAVATLGPTIKAKDSDIAYAISATFVFDLITVLLFPWIGHLLGLTDTGYGLWIGTAVNDTSSVVAAGYAFSDVAGSLATIVKLTRTLFIIPIVIIFSFIYAKREASEVSEGQSIDRPKINFFKIFPWFILGFVAVVGIRSTGLIPLEAVSSISFVSKFCLAMALASIGMKTSLKEVKNMGYKPMLAGVIIDTSVVIVSLIAQYYIVSLLV